MASKPIKRAVAAAQERAMRAAQARDRTSVITFRTTEQERALMEMVARDVGESLSEFVRSSAVDVALALMAKGGGEAALIERYTRTATSLAEQKVLAVMNTALLSAQRGSVD